MNQMFLKSLVAVGAVAMMFGCSDNSSDPAVDPCNTVVVTSDAWIIDSGNGNWVVYPAGPVTDAAGNPVGTFDGVSNIVAADGTPLMQDIDVGALTVCPVNAYVDPNTGTIEKFSSASADNTSSESNGSENPNSSAGNGAGNQDLTSSASNGTENPNSSADGVSGSSAAELGVSSNSAEPVKTSGNPEEDIKKYPVASYKNLLSAGSTQKGWNSRYWDSCKPHCSWMDNVDTSSQAAYAAAGYTVRNCNIHDVEIPTFTLSKGLERYWWGMEGVPSSCKIGAGGSFTCTDMAPIKVNDTLSYGFVAGPSNQGCGKCYHLQYDGSTSNMGNGGPDVKDTHIALKGKHMIVMASNIGHDVDASSTQFDLLVPGGGVGIFNALSTQIGKTPEELGKTNGGILGECLDKLGYWKVTKEQYQECVIEQCDVVFDSTAWPHLNRGCKWLATFFEAADNPSFVWEEVECPQYLVDKYRTTLSLELETNILYSEKWDNYKGDGQFITTNACSRTANAQGEHCDPDQLAADKAKTY